MNNDFQSWYLALLRKQVEDEIQFLVTNGHQAEKVSDPCMFCVDTQKGYYRCGRLTELKQFASSIMTHVGQKRGIERERRAIGYEPATIVHEDDSLLLNSPMDVPLIVIK